MPNPQVYSHTPIHIGIGTPKLPTTGNVVRAVPTVGSPLVGSTAGGNFLTRAVGSFAAAFTKR